MVGYLTLDPRSKFFKHGLRFETRITKSLSGCQNSAAIRSRWSLCCPASGRLYGGLAELRIFTDDWTALERFARLTAGQQRIFDGISEQTDDGWPDYEISAQVRLAVLS